MENINNIYKQPDQFVQTNNNTFYGKNSIIIILLILLIFSFLGINLLTILGNALNYISIILGPFVINILSFFGYTTGSILNETVNIVGDTAKTGIDIAQGSLNNVGNLLKDVSDDNIEKQNKNSIDNILNFYKGNIYNEPKPQSTESPIQKPISSNKNKWCLIGEYDYKHGCIEINEGDKCLSGQTFPSKNKCLSIIK